MLKVELAALLPSSLRAEWKAIRGIFKEAATVFAPSMVTEQVPVPEQPPDQPAKVEPAAGAIVSVTTVPEA